MENEDGPGAEGEITLDLGSLSVEELAGLACLADELADAVMSPIAEQFLRLLAQTFGIALQRRQAGKPAGTVRVVVPMALADYAQRLQASLGGVMALRARFEEAERQARAGLDALRGLPADGGF